MDAKKLNNPFLEKNDQDRWDELLNFEEIIDKKIMKDITKHAYKRIPRNKRKSLLILLLSIYLENKGLKIKSAQKRITSFKLKLDLLKPGLSQRLMGAKGQSPEDLATEEYTEMYINIGKDKKVFPQHLVQFLTANLDIKPTKIKKIRVFDTYSFFSIPKDLGDKAIILLSVKKFRGKNIRVNFSKKKD